MNETQSNIEAQGTLTPAQHEILSVVWDAGPSGASVAEIWQQIGRGRSIARTTILNLVDRLEKRGWLRRQPETDPLRYLATVARDQAAGRLTKDFVNDFFDGSASKLVASLLGSQRLEPEEVARLHELIQQAAEQSAEEDRQ